MAPQKKRAPKKVSAPPAASGEPAAKKSKADAAEGSVPIPVATDKNSVYAAKVEKAKQTVFGHEMFSNIFKVRITHLRKCARMRMPIAKW